MKTRIDFLWCASVVYIRPCAFKVFFNDFAEKIILYKDMQVNKLVNK